MAELQGKELVKRKQQPIKEIIHQDIFRIQETLGQLQAWSEMLSTLQLFFDQRECPLNKKKIAKEYHACSQVFTVFHQDYVSILDTLDKQMEELRVRPKLKKQKA